MHPRTRQSPCPPRREVARGATARLKQALFKSHHRFPEGLVTVRLKDQAAPVQRPNHESLPILVPDLDPTAARNPLGHVGVADSISEFGSSFFFGIVATCSMALRPGS